MQPFGLLPMPMGRCTTEMVDQANMQKACVATQLYLDGKVSEAVEMANSADRPVETLLAVAASIVRADLEKQIKAAEDLPMGQFL
jgi:hypothetical protein